MENKDQVLAADVAAPVVEQPVVEKAEPEVADLPTHDRIALLEQKVAELEEKVAKLDEFLVPHGHNRVIPEVVEPQCQSEVAEPQSE